MNAQIRPQAASSSAARLLIHAAGELRARRRLFNNLLRRLLAFFSSGPLRDERQPLTLQINDALGDRVLAVGGAGTLVDVALPAGTYHVTAHLGEVQRGYTMTLQGGASVDLHLRLAPDRP